jgi:hypothetical protein
VEDGYNGFQKKRIKITMKTIISAFAGLALIIGTAMAAQAPAASPATTDNTAKTTTNKVKKHKKHTAAKTATTPQAAPVTAAPAK